MSELPRDSCARRPPASASVLELAEMTVLHVADVGLGHGQNCLSQGVTFSLSRVERACGNGAKRSRTADEEQALTWHVDAFVTALHGAAGTTA